MKMKMEDYLMNREIAKSKLVGTFRNIPFSELKTGDINNLIDKIYDDFENIINIEIDKLNNKIHKGFCDDKTQDKNYEIFDKISILENIKKNLNAN